MKPDLSIIIPAFDEQGRLARSIGKILEYATREMPAAELIVVDDGSADRTAASAREACAAFPAIPTKVISYEPNRGKGFAVRTGMRAARSDIALFTDADLSTPIEELPKLVRPILEGRCDVAFGSRALDRSLIGIRQPWRREQGGKVFNLMVRLLTGLPFWDTQCGFKAFNLVKFGPLLDLMQIDRFGFDVEFIYVARIHGLRLLEIPVRWDHDERTKVNVFRDSQRMIREVLEIRRNARRGIYDLAEPAGDAAAGQPSET